MSGKRDDLVIPPKSRSGEASTSSSTSTFIEAPDEAAFTSTFGRILPAAQYLQTTHGRAAYYEIKPSSAAVADSPATTTSQRVLLLHGLQTPAVGMLPLARAMQSRLPHAHMVLVDLWGHGLTGTPIVPHVPSLFHQLIDDLLDHLHWQSTHLVGFSFGGILTASYAASRPSRVTTFSLIAPAGVLRFSEFSPDLQSSLKGTDEAAAREEVMEFLEGGELVVPPDWKERVRRGDIVAEAVRQWQIDEHRGQLASMVAIFRDGGVMDNDDEFVKAVKTGIPSIAVLGGTDDVCGEEDLKKVGFENVHVISGVGHGVVRERAVEVAELVCDFLVQTRQDA